MPELPIGNPVGYLIRDDGNMTQLSIGGLIHHPPKRCGWNRVVSLRHGTFLRVFWHAKRPNRRPVAPRPWEMSLTYIGASKIAASQQCGAG